MSKVSTLLEQSMRKEGFVSAAVVAAQYGVTRAQLLEVVLQGRVKPAKPDGSSSFFVLWADMLREFGKPADFRAHPTLKPVEDAEDLLMLDGMLPPEVLDESLESDANKTAAVRKAKQQTPASTNTITIRPADFNKE